MSIDGWLHGRVFDLCSGPRKGSEEEGVMINWNGLASSSIQLSFFFSDD